VNLDWPCAGAPSVRITASTPAPQALAAHHCLFTSRVDHISPVNLVLSERTSFRELPQDSFSAEAVVAPPLHLLDPRPSARAMLDGYARLRRCLGGTWVSTGQEVGNEILDHLPARPPTSKSRRPLSQPEVDSPARCNRTILPPPPVLKPA